MTEDKMEIVRLHMRDKYDVAPWEWDSGELEMAIYDLITNKQAKNNEVLDLVSYRRELLINYNEHLQAEYHYANYDESDVDEFLNID